MIKVIALSLMISFPLIAAETFIALKVNNEIITNTDIKNETRYLIALNNELKETNIDIINDLAKESLIREKIKKNEITKYFEFNQTEEYLNSVIKNYYEKLGIDDLENFKLYLKEYDLELTAVKHKIEIELLWNKLIGSRYQDQISINNEILKKKIEDNFKDNELISEYELSEIIFQIENESEMKKKIDMIQKDIIEQGFKNAANINSIAETSKFGGNLGWVSEKQLSKKIADVLKILSVNQISEPIKIANGFMILKINDKREKKIENDKEKLLQELIKAETNKKYSQFSIIYYNKLKLNSIISE
ncbi:peptidylprolyl isomerase [Candidatus Pelagibacter sp.]|nr:peptidylprolyl isomerase [Candidatus Pelagibacter sp.]